MTIGGTLTNSGVAYSWTGVSGNWKTASDWTPAGGPPTSSDSATISATGTYTVTVDSADAASSLTFSSADATPNDAGSSASLTIGGTLAMSAGALNVATESVASGVLTVNGALDLFGGALNVNAGGQVNLGGTLNYTGGTLTLNGGTIAGAGVVQVSNGAVLDVAANSTIASSFALTGGGGITGSATLTVSGAATFGGSGLLEAGAGTTLLEGATTDTGIVSLDNHYVLENAGTFDVTGGAVFYLGKNPAGAAGSGTIENDAGGTFDFQTASAVYNVYGANAFVNAGTLEQTVTTGTTDIEVPFTNTGTVSVQSGTLEFDGGGSSSGGTFRVASGATLDFGGGTRFTLSGDAFSGAGTVQLSAETGFFVAANSTIASSFALAEGDINGSATLTVSGAATISGSLNGLIGGGTTLLEGATTDTGVVYLDNHSALENAGAFDVTGSAAFYVGMNPYGSAGTGTVENDAGGRSTSRPRRRSTMSMARTRSSTRARWSRRSPRERPTSRCRSPIPARCRCRAGRSSSTAAVRLRAEPSRWRAGRRSISAAARGSRYRATLSAAPARCNCPPRPGSSSRRIRRLRPPSRWRKAISTALPRSQFPARRRSAAA